MTWPRTGFAGRLRRTDRLLSPVAGAVGPCWKTRIDGAAQSDGRLTPSTAIDPPPAGLTVSRLPTGAAPVLAQVKTVSSCCPGSRSTRALAKAAADTLGGFCPGRARPSDGAPGRKHASAAVLTQTTSSVGWPW